MRAITHPYGLKCGGDSAPPVETAKPVREIRASSYRRPVPESLAWKEPERQVQVHLEQERQVSLHPVRLASSLPVP